VSFTKCYPQNSTRFLWECAVLFNRTAEDSIIPSVGTKSTQRAFRGTFFKRTLKENI